MTSQDSKPEAAHVPRSSAYPIEPLFLERWSPRAFDGSPVRREHLATMLEAARWAPSAFNSQPWRFVYVLREDSDWDRLLHLLIPFNVAWARRAAALIFICSDPLIRSSKPGQPDQHSHSHSFDTGAAWAMIALQAARLGYAAHGMTGINFETAGRELNAPDRFRLEAAVAIGRPGAREQLPESLRAREAPSLRKPLDQIVSHIGFDRPAEL